MRRLALVACIGALACSPLRGDEPVRPDFCGSLAEGSIRQENGETAFQLDVARKYGIHQKNIVGDGAWYDFLKSVETFQEEIFAGKHLENYRSTQVIRICAVCASGGDRFEDTCQLEKLQIDDRIYEINREDT